MSVATGQARPIGAVRDPVERLGAEWRRIDVLARCLVETRAGRTPPEALLAELRDAHAAVTVESRPARWIRVLDAVARHAGVPTIDRATSPGPSGTTLDESSLDVLACVAAPLVDPAIARRLRALHVGGSGPLPTVDLIAELLALEPREHPHLERAIGPDGPLRRLGLIRVPAGAEAQVDPLAPIEPSASLVFALTGRPPRLRVPAGARLIHPSATRDDLVVPADHLRRLDELLAYVRLRTPVVTEWRAPDTGGPIGLFVGPSGTGKSFAAAVVASDLGWSLLRVDLGQLVSKYLGETERNLNELFDAASGQPTVLLFDEADALFGRRAEIRDARDRYANLEVSHLLARIEVHRGPCILTSNLRGNLDAAFVRRFHVVIEFIRPDAAARERLWRIHLPARAPGIERLDVGLLAGAVPLTGGEIRNAATHAAFAAAAAGEPIGLHHVTRAIWLELGKDGSTVRPADLGPLAGHLDAPAAGGTGPTGRPNRRNGHAEETPE